MLVANGLVKPAFLPAHKNWQPTLTMHLRLPWPPPLPLCPSQYFKSRATLPSSAYWQGIVKNDSTGLFNFADGTPVPQTYSQVPYAHWAYTYHTKLLQGGLSCKDNYPSTIRARIVDLYICNGLKAGVI